MARARGFAEDSSTMLNQYSLNAILFSTIVIYIIYIVNTVMIMVDTTAEAGRDACTVRLNRAYVCDRFFHYPGRRFFSVTFGQPFYHWRDKRVIIQSKLRRYCLNVVINTSCMADNLIFNHQSCTRL